VAYLTDRRHLATVTNQLMAAIIDLDEMWRQEDSAACAPSGGRDGPSSPGPSDPTSAIASRDRKFVDRDRIGGLLLHLLSSAQDTIERNTPRTPTERCLCCETEMATHGRMCWACDKYLRATGYHCDPQIHDDRPTVRMCECPPECCEVCPDRAAEGRTESERCKKRRQRKAA